TVTLTHVDRVVAVRSHEEVRNTSDTLDYTDFRTVRSTYAVVYQGRTREDGTPREPIERFAIVDCTNLWTHRGQPHREPVVDEHALEDPEIAADYAAWRSLLRDKAEKAHKERQLREEERRRQVEERRRNRPERGKQMRVVS